MKDIALHPRWKTLVDGAQIPKESDPRDNPIPFVLTQRERDKAVVAKLELEQKRRQRNREDDARALGVALGELA